MKDRRQERWYTYRETILYGFVFLHILSSETLTLFVCDYLSRGFYFHLLGRQRWCLSPGQRVGSFACKPLIKDLFSIRSVFLSCEINPLFVQHPWVSSAPHPLDWVLKGKGCEHKNHTACCPMSNKVVFL